MKECPQCGAAYRDDDLFCESDGTALDGAPPISGPVSPRATDVPPPCRGCGKSGSNDGGGYCMVCGDRLEVSLSPTSIPPTATVGKWLVLGARGTDDFLAQGQDGGAALLVIGADETLAAEAEAIDVLAPKHDLPRVIDRGHDRRWGAFVALTWSLDGARWLGDVGPAMSVAEALGTLRAALDLADHFERAGFDWSPTREDLYIDAAGTLRLPRLRGARKLAPRERIDARAVVEAVGAAFLPLPAVRGTTRFVRFVSPQYLLGADRHGTLDHERTELATLEAEHAAGEPRPSDDVVSVVCDPGMKRGYNEDAGQVATGVRDGEPWAVLVVCDGVSSSTHAEKASAIATKTACDTLAHFAAAGDIAYEGAAQAVATAVRAAHIAICAQRFDHGANEPPGTTIVTALVHRRRITVGWVGDSRAYWITPTGGELLTRDHSWVNETVARGEMTEDEAMRQPLAHALTRCLGPLEVGEGLELVEPEVRSREVDAPGLVVLCSDGLWNYFPSAPDLARLLREADEGDDGGARILREPAAVARRLVNNALERGGHDNVTVAVFALP